MCGIAGIYLPKTNSINIETPLRRMQCAIRHRGPDDEGLYLAADGTLGLAHSRLSILDLSPAGHQPMVSPDGRYWITFNGEIYNFRELRRELESAGERFVSQSDTEIILRLHALYGVQGLQKLRGMFALGLWDGQERTLLLARDRLGIKPLYYCHEAGRILFASEVRAILATELVSRQIDPIALNEYLAYQSVPAPATLLKDIRMLPPGAYLTINASGQMEETQYWDLLQNQEPAARIADKPATVRKIGELLRESVALHLVSDVSVGVFLSGGIDSSAITALIRETGQTPHTFSVVFAERNFDESVYARQVAERFGAEHTEIQLTERAMLDQLPVALSAMDQPTGDGVNSYVVSEAVRKAGVKVALSGLGGDEFFAGYSTFSRLERALKFQQRGAHVPAVARNLFARVIELAGGNSVQASKAAAMLKSDGSLAAMYPVTRQVLSLSQRQSLLNEQWRQLNDDWRDPYAALLQSAFQHAGTTDFLTQISYAEARTYMHDVLLRDSDQMSMAHALEVRVPLLDHKLVEYVMGVPGAMKRPNGTPKSLLVASLGDLLPRDVVHRPKQGFTLPFANWMRGALRTFCETRLDPQRIAGRGLFDAREVSRLWKLFLAESPEVSWSRLWVLVVLEEWLEQNRIQCRA